MSTYDAELSLLLLDKGLLALLALLVGFVLNWGLQRSKSQDDLRNALAVDRARSYQCLWKILAVAPASGLSRVERADLEVAMTDWYHDQSGALHMSWWTARRFIRVLDSLRATPPTAEHQLRKQISRLRTSLKRDCGRYGFFGQFIDVGPARPSPKRP